MKSNVRNQLWLTYSSSENHEAAVSVHYLSMSVLSFWKNIQYQNIMKNQCYDKIQLPYTTNNAYQTL